MPFTYHDINTAKKVQDETFIFDANVWLFYLNPNPKSREKPYIRFLNYLLRQQDDPVVYLPAAVLSEVVNRLLKGVYFARFTKLPNSGPKIAQLSVKEQQNPDIVQKKVYRTDAQYIADRNDIFTRIFSYSANLKLIQDEFNEVALDDLTTMATTLDFTDWLIYRMAEVEYSTIVTDDGDFIIENYPIITHNPNLLALNPTP